MTLKYKQETKSNIYFQDLCLALEFKCVFLLLGPHFFKAVLRHCHFLKFDIKSHCKLLFQSNFI